VRSLNNNNNNNNNTLRLTFNQITNSNVSDTQWLQASLPIKEGDGFETGCFACTPPPFFLASAASTISLQDSILALHPCPRDPFSILTFTSGHHRSVFQSLQTIFHSSSRFGIDQVSCVTVLLLKAALLILNSWRDFLQQPLRIAMTGCSPCQLLIVA